MKLTVTISGETIRRPIILGVLLFLGCVLAMLTIAAGFVWTLPHWCQ